VLRLGLVLLAGLAPAAAERLWLFADSVGNPTDPTSFLPSLGIGGLVAGVLYLWMRDVSKRLTDQRDDVIQQRDRLMDQLSDLLPALRESTAAHNASTRATEEMTELMRYRWPDPPERSPRRRGE
jgi:hypothetical protein